MFLVFFLVEEYTHAHLVTGIFFSEISQTFLHAILTLFFLVERDTYPPLQMLFCNAIIVPSFSRVLII